MKWKCYAGGERFGNIGADTVDDAARMAHTLFINPDNPDRLDFFTGTGGHIFFLRESSRWAE